MGEKGFLYSGFEAIRGRCGEKLKQGPTGKERKSFGDPAPLRVEWKAKDQGKRRGWRGGARKKNRKEPKTNPYQGKERNNIPRNCSGTDPPQKGSNLSRESSAKKEGSSPRLGGGAASSPNPGQKSLHPMACCNPS